MKNKGIGTAVIILIIAIVTVAAVGGYMSLAENENGDADDAGDAGDVEENAEETGETKMSLPSYFLSDPTPSQVASINYEPNFPIDRWNHTEITIELGSVPQAEYERAVKNTVSLWENSTTLIENDDISGSYFDFVFVEGGADIVVSWVDALPVDAIDALGDTNRIRTETGGDYRNITNAEILLKTEKNGKKLTENGMVNLAVHEFGHALGLNHVDNKASVMYPYIEIPSPGINHISALDIAMIREYYREAPLPDLEISSDSVSVAKERGAGSQFYLDLEATVNNTGILASGDTLFVIEADGEKVLERNWEEKIDPGSSRGVNYSNIPVDSDFSDVKITADYGDQIQEYEEGNNSVTKHL